MEIFSDLDEFARITAGIAKWDRTSQAIQAAQFHPERVMHSIGDSLTYIRTTRRHETDLFTGHRRYVEVVAADASPVQIEIAQKHDLTPFGDYSDLTDREYFEGSGQDVRLEPGQVLITAIDEALRYPAPTDTPYTVVHVTVEGATFHNK